MFNYCQIILIKPYLMPSRYQRIQVVYPFNYHIMINIYKLIGCTITSGKARIVHAYKFVFTQVIEEIIKTHRSKTLPRQLRRYIRR